MPASSTAYTTVSTRLDSSLHVTQLVTSAYSDKKCDTVGDNQLTEYFFASVNVLCPVTGACPVPAVKTSHQIESAKTGVLENDCGTFSITQTLYNLHRLRDLLNNTNAIQFTQTAGPSQ